MEGGFTGNISLVLHGYLDFVPSTIHMQVKKLAHRPEVPKCLSTLESMVDFYPPLDTTVDIYPNLTHLGLTRGGDLIPSS
jgi:hypothetical protein